MKKQEDIFANIYAVDLLCSKRPTIEKQTLLRRLKKWCPGVKPLDPDPSSSLLSFVHPRYPVTLADGGIPAQTFIAVCEKPSGSDDIESAIQQSWRFEGARDTVARASSVVLVSDLMSRALERRQRLDLFQRALRAVLDVVDCEAIYWRPSGHIVDPQSWRSTFDRYNAAQLFMCGAVNVRLFNVEKSKGELRGDIVMDTLGLGAIGLPDLQCHFWGVDCGAVARVLYNTSCYIFTEGDVIENGHTVAGIEPDSRWKCQHEEALIAPARVVLDLNPGPPYAAGKRAIEQPAPTVSWPN